MKTIYLVRHAKSSWKDESLDDIDRPLNRRGRRDAPFMSKLVLAKEGKPDLILTSPATRAHTTAVTFAEAMRIDTDDSSQFRIIDDIYEASERELIQVLQSHGGEADRVMLFGHNPSMTALANRFEGDYIANVPTCAVVKATADVTSWSDFEASEAKRKAFYFPKQYFQ